MPSSSLPDGQRHDRLDEGSGRLIQVSAELTENEDGMGEITVWQRMMSATAGSLLTSLLVTPLDVVRVRLQAQPRASTATSTVSSSLQPSFAPTALSSSSPFGVNTSNLSPAARFPGIANLGVTSCCREVFWTNNVAAHCYATPAAPTISGMQVPVHATNTSTMHCAIEDTKRKAFTSTWDGLKKIARTEGLTSLWRGLSPTLLMAIPGNVIYFSGYDALRYGKSSPIRQYVPDTYTPLVAGSFARVISAVFVSPIEMFRTRMQASSGGQRGIIPQTLSGMKDLVAAQGYTSLWRGLGLTIWRDVPFSGVYWWGYEAIRNQLTDLREQRRGRQHDRSELRSRNRSRSRDNDGHAVTLVDSFVAGALSGSVASIMTMPFDVGKTRQQILEHKSDSSALNSNGLGGRQVSGSGSKALLPEQMSMPRFLVHIFREEGMAGLFKGWIPRTMKVAPACAIMISSYELGKKFASSANTKRQDKLAVT